MDFDTNWDIDKYKSPFECDEHWELRRNFLVAHKDKYPEDKLICLAQVFFNVELLGCKYPDETMQLIADLSEGIADTYREKKERKIQRTFVKASDAAEAKFKGLSTRPRENNECVNKLPDSGIQHSSSSSVVTPNNTVNNLVNKAENVISTDIIDLSKPLAFRIIQNLVIWKTSEASEEAFNIIQRSMAKEKIPMKFHFKEKSVDTPTWNCDVVIQGRNFASAVASSKQNAKSAACESLLLKLQDYCYTIEEKVKILSDGNTIVKDSDHDASKSESYNSDTNVGSRIMKSMGWKGGGLGKSGQGIAEPVAAQNHVNRAGLGTNLSSPQIMEKLRKKLQNYSKDDTQYDLVFSCDFSKEERANLHALAKRFHLKTRSYGSGDSRYLVVSKPTGSSLSIVNSLLASGGENDRFRLIPPTTETTDDL